MKKALLTTALFVFALSSAGYADDAASEEMEAATVEENVTAEVENISEESEDTTLSGLIYRIKNHNIA